MKAFLFSGMDDARQEKRLRRSKKKSVRRIERKGRSNPTEPWWDDIKGNELDEGTVTLVVDFQLYVRRFGWKSSGSGRCMSVPHKQC